MRRKRVIGLQRVEQRAGGASERLHFKTIGCARLYRYQDSVGGSDERRSVMNKEVTAGILRKQIHRRGPMDRGQGLGRSG